MKLLQSIPNTVGPKGGAVSQWHKLLGWFSPSPDAPQNENLTLIKKQAYLLWSHRIVKLLLGNNVYTLYFNYIHLLIFRFVAVDKLKALSVGYEKVDFPNAQTGSTNLFKRALERTNVGGSGGHKTSANASSRPWRKVGSDDVTRVALVCGMYHAALTTLSQLKLDILSGKRRNSSFYHRSI